MLSLSSMADSICSKSTMDQIKKVIVKLTSNQLNLIVAQNTMSTKMDQLLQKLTHLKTRHYSLMAFTVVTWSSLQPLKTTIHHQPPLHLYYPPQDLFPSLPCPHPSPQPNLESSSSSKKLTHLCPSTQKLKAHYVSMEPFLTKPHCHSIVV